MATTPQEFLAIIAPEFTPVKYDVDGAILVAKIRVDNTLFAKPPEDVYNLLTAYLAAHILTIGGRPMGSSGDLSSIQVGAVSLAYSANKTSTKNPITALSQTSYGNEYARQSAAYRFSPMT